MLEYQTFFNIKLSTIEKLQYKNIVKCIGNYNDCYVYIVKYKYIIL